MPRLFPFLLLFAAALLFAAPVYADTPPTAVFIERFTSFTHADGARTTAFWDVTAGWLTLRPPDAGSTRRWPALASAPAGSLRVVWVEDRGQGAFLWAQEVDANGNRLWPADRALTAWQGDFAAASAAAHRLSLARAGSEYRLAWSDSAGVWFGVWQEALTQVQQVSADAADLVAVRCAQGPGAPSCALLWQTPAQSAVAVATPAGSVQPLHTTAGPLAAAWQGDALWLSWNDAGLHVQSFDAAGEALTPAWTLTATGTPRDLAAAGSDLWLLTAAPFAALRIHPAGSDPPLVASYPLAPDALSARLAAGAGRAAAIWYSATPDALAVRWWDGIGQPAEAPAFLLRLGVAGQSPLLGDAAMIGDGALAAAWTEAHQVFVRPWLPGGWSPWRHEVAPAYAFAPGLAVAEGLGHSLAVNAPGQLVTSVRLEAGVQLNGGSAQFFVSNQGPREWQPLAPGQQLQFLQPGSDLRWYVRLRRGPGGGAPVVDEVRLQFTYQHRVMMGRYVRE